MKFSFDECIQTNVMANFTQICEYEKIHIHQDPSNIMGYGIKNVKKEGEVFKLKGELPKCIGDTVILKLIREE